MSSDYYARAVVGVKATKYATRKRVKYQVHKSVVGVKAFDIAGNPLMFEQYADYIEFFGKNFMDDYYRENRSEIGGIIFERGSFKEHLERKGLKWFGYDYTYVHEGDLIGLKVIEENNDQEGISLNKLPAVFTEAKSLLEEVGITEEPKLYASLYHSY